MNFHVQISVKLELVLEFPTIILLMFVLDFGQLETTVVLLLTMFPTGDGLKLIVVMEIVSNSTKI